MCDWPLSSLALSGSLVPPAFPSAKPAAPAAARADGVFALLTGTVLRESVSALCLTPPIAGVDLGACAAAGFGAAATSAMTAGVAAAVSAAAACCDAGCVGSVGAAASSVPVRDMAAHASCAFVALAALVDAGGETAARDDAGASSARGVTKIAAAPGPGAPAAPLEASLLTAHAILGALDARDERVRGLSSSGASAAVVAAAFAEGTLPAAATALGRLAPPMPLIQPRVDAPSSTLPTIRQLLHHGLRTVAVTGTDDGSTTSHESYPRGFATHYLLGAPVSKGKWYFEVELVSDVRCFQIGWASDRAVYNVEAGSGRLSVGVGDDDFSWSWCSMRHLAYHGTEKPGVEYPKSANSAVPKPVGSKDTVGVLFDVDAGTIEYTCNGVSAGVCHRDVRVPPTSSGPAFWFPAISYSATGRKARFVAGSWPTGAAAQWLLGENTCRFRFPPADRTFLPISAAAAGGLGVPGVIPTEPAPGQLGFGAPQCVLFRPGSVAVAMDGRAGVSCNAPEAVDLEFAGSSGFTVEALVRADQSGGTRDSWASVARGAAQSSEPATIAARGADGIGGWALQILPQGCLVFTAYGCGVDASSSAPDANYYGAIAKSADGVVQPGIWAHVAVVVHSSFRPILDSGKTVATSQNVTLYVNGHVVFSGPLASRAPSGSALRGAGPSMPSLAVQQVLPWKLCCLSVGARLTKVDLTAVKSDVTSNQAPFDSFLGRLAYVRVWSVARTVASLRDTMHRCALLPCSTAGTSLDASQIAETSNAKDGASRVTMSMLSNSRAAVRHSHHFAPCHHVRQVVSLTPLSHSFPTGAPLCRRVAACAATGSVGGTPSLVSGPARARSSAIDIECLDERRP